MGEGRFAVAAAYFRCVASAAGRGRGLPYNSGGRERERGRVNGMDGGKGKPWTVSLVVGNERKVLAAFVGRQV